MCYRSGYESVALIRACAHPLQVGNRTFGLIQMNDLRENMFTSEAIERYECLADHEGKLFVTHLRSKKK